MDSVPSLTAHGLECVQVVHRPEGGWIGHDFGRSRSCRSVLLCCCRRQLRATSLERCIGYSNCSSCSNPLPFSGTSLLSLSLSLSESFFLFWLSHLTPFQLDLIRSFVFPRPHLCNNPGTLVLSSRSGLGQHWLEDTHLTLTVIQDNPQSLTLVQNSPQSIRCFFLGLGCVLFGFFFSSFLFTAILNLSLLTFILWSSLNFYYYSGCLKD